MTLAIRRLDPIADQAIYRWSYNWLVDSPRWRQQAESVFGTMELNEYLYSRLVDTRLDIGIFTDGIFVAKIALHLTAKHTYEVSLEAARGTDSAVIIAAGLAIRDQLFGEYGAECVYAWVPRWAKGVVAILTSIGFTDDCVTMARGTARGRLVEWKRYSLRKAHEQ